MPPRGNADKDRATGAWHARNVGAAWSMPIILAIIVPVGMFLAFEVAPPEYRARLEAFKPGHAAVRSSLVPPAASPKEDAGPARTPTPEFVKGIYVTSAAAGHPTRFPDLVRLVEETELNAMVIDIKDGYGRLAFSSADEALAPHVAARPSLGDLDEFTAPLREKGIYLIARLFVFQDPYYTEAHPDLAVLRPWGGLWRDYKGVPWLDPSAKDVWKYNVAVAKEAHRGGFDEIQFDYIRFPSDGNISAAVYPHWDGETSKADIMEEFFGYLDTELRVKRGIPTSVDLFGLTMWLHDTDLNIGQRLDKAVTHFDFISPMVYPSHYPSGFLGFANPAAHPYDIVYENLVRGQAVFDAAHAENERLREQEPAVELPTVATARPWIQDFDLGANYTPALVRAQMTATEDAGGSGWLLWNARNVYTRGALASADDGGPADGIIEE